MARSIWRGVHINIAPVASETGALLQQYLEERGAYNPQSKATVCYGRSSSAFPALNANCSVDKIMRMKIMQRAEVRTVPWFKAGESIPSNIKFPLLARKASGHGGLDIVPVFQRQEVAWRIEAGWDWFSSYIPVAQEFRVWIFRDQILDTYEKVMVRPGDFKHIGRNFRNGFDFFVTGLRATPIVREATNALAALELDFGAVDLLLGEDGKVYILEVNTAPGVIKSGAQNTLGKLADCIVKWSQEGYPRWGRPEWLH